MQLINQKLETVKSWSCESSFQFSINNSQLYSAPREVAGIETGCRGIRCMSQSQLHFLHSRLLRIFLVQNTKATNCHSYPNNKYFIALKYRPNLKTYLRQNNKSLIKSENACHFAAGNLPLSPAA